MMLIFFLSIGMELSNSEYGGLNHMSPTFGAMMLNDVRAATETMPVLDTESSNHP